MIDHDVKKHGIKLNPGRTQTTEINSLLKEMKY